jgi:hypothetical protein
MKFFTTLLFFVLLTASLPAQITAFLSEEMIVTASSLNLRDAPDKNAKKVASLTQGAVVQVLEAYNNGEYVQADTTDPESPYAPWLKVRYKGMTGWAFGAYLTGTIGLHYENDIFPEGENLPPLQWFGVYARDSFADEVRRVQVRLADEFNEFFQAQVRVLKTNQPEMSKFLIASLQPIPTGYCGPLGNFEIGEMYFSKTLNPGGQLSIYPGNDLNDTIMRPTYGIAATGCATLENTYVRVTDYQLRLIDFSQEPAQYQDLTKWVKPESPDSSPSVDLLWFGDIDRDGKPDAIINDCPYEVGCRASLFLSSKAPKGDFLTKVCEHYWPGD